MTSSTIRARSQDRRSAGVSPRRSTRARSNSARLAFREPTMWEELASDGVGPHLPGADPMDLLDGENPDFPVADLAGPGGGQDGIHHRLDLVVVDDHLDLDFGHEIDLVFGAAIDLGVAALPAEPLGLHRGHAFHPELPK